MNKTNEAVSRIKLTYDQWRIVQDWWEATLEIVHDSTLPVEIKSPVLRLIDEFPLYYCESMESLGAWMAARAGDRLVSARERRRRLKERTVKDEE